MARKQTKAKNTGFTMFDVVYADGSVTSNRRVDNAHLDQSFGDDVMDLARAAIEEQDRLIAERAKQRRAKIKSITKAK